MQTRTLNDLINAMLSFIGKLDKPRTDVEEWLKVISYNDIDELKKLLESLRVGGDVPLSPNAVAPLVAFLKERHGRKFTDAFSCVRPDLPCVKAGYELARQLSPVMDMPAYDLLLGLDSRKYHFELVNGDLSALPLHRIMLDKEGNPLDVVENLFKNILPLQARAETNQPLKKFLPRNAVSRNDLFLSEEAALLKMHSVAVKNFQQKLTNNHIEEGKTILLQEYSNPNFIVGSSYGVEGMRSLKAKLFASFQDPDKFIACFANFSEPQVWKEKLLPDVEPAELARMMLQITDLPMAKKSDHPQKPLADAIDANLGKIKREDFDFSLGEKVVRAKLVTLTTLYLFARPISPPIRVPRCGPPKCSAMRCSRAPRSTASMTATPRSIPRQSVMIQLITIRFWLIT